MPSKMTPHAASATEMKQRGTTRRNGGSRVRVSGNVAAAYLPNKFADSALKFFSPSSAPTRTTYFVLGLLDYLAWLDLGL